jgi:hypothetical protein
MSDKQTRGTIVPVEYYQTLLAAVIVFLPGVILVIISYLPSLRHHTLWAQILEGLGVVLIVSGTLGGMVQAFMLRFRQHFENQAVKFLREQVEEQLQLIANEVKNQTARSIAAVSSLVSSLAAMHESAVARIYPSRDQAADDMARVVQDPEVNRVELIAVSLNSFIREPGALREAWRHLEELIQGKKRLSNRSGRLDIKVLIIDPNCFGAQLRSRGESRVAAAIAGQLQTEARETAEHLLSLKQAAQNTDHTGVSFDFRLYRTTPIFFLLHTDVASYLQPYYFWSSRQLETEAPNPVLSFKGRPELPWTSAFQDQLEDHFQWLWKHAAVTAEEVLVESQYGLDRGLHDASAINVFNNPEDGKQRILSALAGTRKRVFIQGVSLDSFFDQGSPLFDSIARLAETDEVEIKCLILDPESDQAKYRAYREYLIGGQDVSFDDFANNGELYHKSQLYRDTQSTLENIRVVLAPMTNRHFQIRLYDSAPACFMLLADDRVLVEQYHYGKVSDGTERFPVILGKQMPLIEYGAADGDLYKQDPMRNPVKLLEDHFLFVFNRCSRLPDGPHHDSAGRHLRHRRWHPHAPAQ